MATATNGGAAPRVAEDYILELPVSIQEALLGGKVTVPTIDGQVAVTIPPGSNTGTGVSI